jgi:formylglycine-generating enzyme required for sulfatase activity
MKSHQHSSRSVPFSNAHRGRPRRQAGVFLLLCALACAGPLAAWAASPPGVTNVTAAQRVGTKLVDIGYTLSDPDSVAVNVYILVSTNHGDPGTWVVPAHTCTGDYGPNVAVTATPTAKSIVWNAGADWDGQYTEHCRVRVLANDAGLVLIPAGSYTRGNRVDSAVGGADSNIADATPLPVYVSAFYMDSTLVNGGLWNGVNGYATSQGYTLNAGSSKAAIHPVQTVNWFDAVKWCNARSQMEGLEPVYYTDAGCTALYTNLQVAPSIKPGAKGYRLPTEAEWEKAARGGLSGKRFPWGDTINENLANYYGDTSFAYDSGPNGFNSTGAVGGDPYTSPVGSFASNGYGLSDMAGNVFEWCWDWYDGSYYTSGQTTDPQGPSLAGTQRVLRGGSWEGGALVTRCAFRTHYQPTHADNTVGFRCVRGL